MEYHPQCQKKLLEDMQIRPSTFINYAEKEHIKEPRMFLDSSMR